MSATLTRIGAVAAKEFTHVRRDRRILAMVLVLPALMLLLMAYAISFDVRNVPTVIVDLDRTPASQSYGRAFATSDLFDVVGHEDSMAAVDDLFGRNVIRVAVVIPAGFARTLAGDEQAQVGILIDGSEPNSAKVAQAYVGALNQLHSQELTRAWADTQAIDTSQFPMVDFRLRTWYNPERRSSDFLIPGLMVVVIMIVTVQQTAVTLVREREQGTEEQLRVSPLRRTELMVGKLLPWTLIAFADVLVITVLGVVVFGVPLRGSLAALGAGAVLLIVASLSLGLIISAVAPSVVVANIAGLLVAFLPAFLLSGFAFALDQIPLILQGISYAFPARHMVALSREVFLKGAGFGEVWPELAWLAAYAAIALLVAAQLQRRRA
ncbi:MAG: ABC transporter permease [Candidatus Nanopelagicales bacterium]